VEKSLWSYFVKGGRLVSLAMHDAPVCSGLRFPLITREVTEHWYPLNIDMITPAFVCHDKLDPSMLELSEQEVIIPLSVPYCTPFP